MFYLKSANESLARSAGGKAYGLWGLGQTTLNVPSTLVVLPDDDVGNIPYVMPSSDRWAVRSSSNQEDSMQRSYAGQYKTLLNVPREGLIEAVCEVRASTLQALAYREILETGDLSAPTIIERISVLIQPMSNHTYSGVVFTGNPETGVRNEMVMEYIRGLGEDLVGGMRNPAGSFKVCGDQILGGPMTKWLSWCPELLRQAKMIEASFSYPLDLEFNGDRYEIIWLQARPLTGVTWNPTTITGVAFQQDLPIVRGTVQRLPSDNPFVEGNILFTRMTDPHMVRDMIKAAAIVTEIGGRTCHAAIIARELGKPCIVGCADSVTFVTGELVDVDVAKQEVRSVIQ